MILGVLMVPFEASAQEVRVDESAEVTSETNVDLKKDTTKSDTSVNNSKDRRENSMDVGTNANASTSAEKNTPSGKAEEHRSRVSTFVHSLLSVADRDAGIGAEVRAVAQAQNDSASSTAKAIAKLENRSKLATFLFGTDWKNVGMLRSEITRTDKDIARLEAASQKTTDAEVRTDLEVQIQALKAEHATLEAFVAARESSFSLFGWFTKMFASA